VTWTDSLRDVADAAHNDGLPRPLHIGFSWTPQGDADCLVVVTNDGEAAWWEVAMRAELDEHLVSHGAVGETRVRIVTTSDAFEQEMARTPGLVTS
jgi:hypothetical protein